jgi:hypothetical protein
MSPSSHPLPTTSDLDTLVFPWIIRKSGGPQTTIDYGVTASDGVSKAHSDELVDITDFFHQSSPPIESYLFWRLSVQGEPKGDWVMVRVTHEGGQPGSHRPTLVYVAIIIRAEEFKKIDFNPRRLIVAGVFDLIFDNATQNVFDEVHIPKGMLPVASTSAPTVSPTLSPIFKSGGEVTESDETKSALLDFVDDTHSLQEPPPTFATWWPSRPDTLGKFHIVLRQENRALIAHDVYKRAEELLTQLRSIQVTNFNEDLLTSIRDHAKQGFDALNKALNTMEKRQWASVLEPAAQDMHSAGIDLIALRHRYAGVKGAEDEAHAYQTIANGFTLLVEEIRLLKQSSLAEETFAVEPSIGPDKKRALKKSGRDEGEDSNQKFQPAPQNTAEPRLASTRPSGFAALAITVGGFLLIGLLVILFLVARNRKHSVTNAPTPTPQSVVASKPVRVTLPDPTPTLENTSNLRNVILNLVIRDAYEAGRKSGLNAKTPTATAIGNVLSDLAKEKNPSQNKNLAPEIIRDIQNNVQALNEAKKGFLQGQTEAAARRETIRREAAKREAARRESIRRESIRRESIRREATKREAIRREATRRETVRREAARRENARREAIRRNSTRREAARREETRRKARREGARRKAQAASNEAARIKRLRRVAPENN